MVGQLIQNLRSFQMVVQLPSKTIWMDFWNGSTACYQHCSNGITMCIQNQWPFWKMEILNGFKWSISRRVNRVIFCFVITFLIYVGKSRLHLHTESLNRNPSPPKKERKKAILQNQLTKNWRRLWPYKVMCHTFSLDLCNVCFDSNIAHSGNDVWTAAAVRSCHYNVHKICPTNTKFLKQIGLNNDRHY